MRILFLMLYLLLMLTQKGLSNNVMVSSVRLTSQNTTEDFTMVEFDITWENSWRYANGPANWDAAWIFVKYRVGNGGNWQHAWLNNTGHVQCSGMTATNGLLTPGAAFHASTNPVMGQFLFRASAGTGNINCQNVQVRWNYGANSVADNAIVDVRVFAIEFVYIPQGNFYVGSGGTEYYPFYTYPNATSPYMITAENTAINVGPANGNLYYSITPPPGGGDQAGPVPAAFPKGYNAFYAMKYELSQKAYVDFLNTLTRVQQASRVESDIANNIGIENRFVMSETTTPQYRNGVSCNILAPPPPGPMDFYCDVNNNGTPNDSTDGIGIPCNYLSYGDLAAYLDWASLRIMTEFELEKCARGPASPVPNEFAWGNTFLSTAEGLLNNGKVNELPIGHRRNVPHSVPVRSGSFATPETDRTTSGAGYYGCMDLTGNLMERGVTIGNAAGRSYTGLHGNGALTSDGHPDVSSWPSYTTGIGIFFRGHCFNVAEYTFPISDRYIVMSSSGLRGYCAGGRGVRTAE